MFGFFVFDNLLKIDLSGYTLVATRIVFSISKAGKVPCEIYPILTAPKKSIK